MICSLLAPHAAPRQDLHGRRQVIVADPSGYAAEVLERLHMAPKERLLVLRREGHHEAAPRIVEPHHKHLHRLSHATNHGDRLPPIHLGILARLKLQWQKDLGRMMLLAPVADILAHA